MQGEGRISKALAAWGEGACRERGGSVVMPVMGGGARAKGCRQGAGGTISGASLGASSLGPCHAKM